MTRTMDCTDIKVIASGFVDAEIDAESRHAAERHLVECSACRERIDQLESLSDRIVAEAATLGGAASGLPDGFAGAVLARTVYDTAPPRHLGWSNWLGWIAAAAALVLAVFVWQLDQSPIIVAPTPKVAEKDTHPNDAYGARLTALRSWVHEGATPTDGEELFELDTDLDGAPALDAAPKEVSRADAELLESTALLLEILAAERADDTSELDRMREIATYEDLLPRLRNAWRRLHPADRQIASVAESVLDRIVNGPVTAENVQDLRETVETLELPARLETLSERGRIDTAM